MQHRVTTDLIITTNDIIATVQATQRATTTHTVTTPPQHCRVVLELSITL